jgi:acetyl esterase/lipase
MLIDRVLIGLGSVVIAGGSVLGWVGFTERGQTASASSAEAPMLRAFGPVPLPAEEPAVAAAAKAAEPSGWSQQAGEGPTADPTASPGDPAQLDDDEAVAAEKAAAEAAARAAAEQKAVEQKAAADKKAAEADAKQAKPAAAAKPAAEPKPASPRDVKELRRTFSYGPYGTKNDMDVYRPAGTATDARLPTIVLVHGGSWVSSSKEVWSGDVAPFLEAGYTTVAVNYRLAGDAAWPAQRTDVVAAVTELRDHASLYNVDPDRVVLLGSSAGAQLAAAAATWDGAVGLVRGFVSLSGPLDMFQVAAATANPKDAELAQRVTEQLIRCSPAECADRYSDATPANHLDPDDAPSLLVAAENDWVDPQGARDFAAASNDLGVPSDLVMLTGAKHGMALWPAARPHAMAWIAARMKD